jgi:hypothetical protein
MSLFSRLFGRNKKPSGIRKPDIDLLLSSHDVNNSIIELDNYICELCAWGEETDKLSAPQMTFYLNQNLEREINNGGFHQYFWNSTGDFALETVSSLQSIGASKTAELLLKAIDRFPGKTVPGNIVQRQHLLEQIETRTTEAWQELDDAFYEYDEDLNALNIEYIRMHRNHF